MKLKLAAIGSAMLLAFAAGPGPASATTLNWNFYTLGGSPSSPGKSLGTTSTFFTQDGMSLLVVSANSNGCTAPYSTWCPGSGDLYVKNGGLPGERGLGLTNDPYKEGEIGNPYGIYLGLQDVGHATDVEMGSVQKGETWSVWGSNGNGTTWTELGSGVGTGSIVNFNASMLAGYDQLIVADPFLANQTGGTDSNNIVLMGITTVPEPGALALFGAGLLGCALFVGRRRHVRQC
jgi:hypothetical protein